MKRKGFTLVELLVVIAIIALLMGILMPALAQVRRLAQRMVCGTNLSGIGKAMMIYSNDCDEEYPRAGGRTSKWTSTGAVSDWDAEVTSGGTIEDDVFGGSRLATITSSFFLLVKYADVTPKQFVCKGDGARAFKLSDFTTTLEDITDAWDFGDKTNTGEGPGDYCSYAYHLPYAHSNGSTNISFAINVSSNPSCPIAADRNPWLDKNAKEHLNDTELIDPDCDSSTKEYKSPDKKHNSAAHQREGQNVLFNDSHVSFEKHPNVGIENDNIWMCWAGSIPTDSCGRQDGENEPTSLGQTNFGPYSESDSCLANEPQAAKMP